MSTPSHSRIAVLMPVFNSLPYLPAAVKSIISQSLRDFVLIAVDDGSTDGSIEYLRSIADPRIHVIADGVHRGMGASLNLALSTVKTRYVARMDSDDLCPPDRFAAQLARLEADASVGVVGTQFSYIGTGGKTGFARHLPLRHEDIEKHLRKGVLAIIHGSLMVRTDLLHKVNGYRCDGVGEDWDLFLRLCETTRFANLSQIAYFYRLHGRNVTSLHHRLTQDRIQYACACADARRAGLEEPSESEYRLSLASRPLLSRLGDRVDAISLAHYFIGREYALNDRAMRGYLHLAIGAVVGPRRVTGRLIGYLRHAGSQS